MTFSLGARSRKAMVGLDPRLIAVIERAIQITPQDFMVNEGVRTPARQRQLYAQGRTAPGPIVTWVKVSNHFAAGDGYGKAVDIYPWMNGKPNLSSSPAAMKAYVDIAKAMFAAAGELGVPLRWGANWDGDGVIREKGETDNPHFEIPKGA